MLPWQLAEKIGLSLYIYIYIYIHIYILFQLKLFHLISGNKKTFLVLILVNYNNPAENAIAEINYSLMLL